MKDFSLVGERWFGEPDPEAHDGPGSGGAERLWWGATSGRAGGNDDPQPQGFRIFGNDYE